jgi:hypothetical protein
MRNAYISCSYWFMALLSSSSRMASGAGMVDDFDQTTPSTMYETGAMSESTDPQWWLNSGGQVTRTGKFLSSVQGQLANSDSFRSLYAESNPLDTDNGYRPQNLLRLVTRVKFKNFNQQVFFNIQNINTSDSPNRNQSNGVFFFNRYQDGKTLYYVGIRVDGTAVIKKKFAGEYTTLKSAVVYPGNYQHEIQPNLLPTHRWIGIRSEVVNIENNSVLITMYMNDSHLGTGWNKVLEVVDSVVYGDTILNEGFAGIRSDFMDVNFDAYAAIENPE